MLCLLTGCSNDLCSPEYEDFNIKQVEELNTDEVSDFDTAGGNDFEAE